jgi:hypothetical protein
MLIRIGKALVDPGEIIMARELECEPPEVEIIFRHGGGCFLECSLDALGQTLREIGCIVNERPRAPLTEEEAALLTELADAGYRYMARDLDGRLYAYGCLPRWGDGLWNARIGSLPPRFIPQGFDFVRATDTAPWGFNGAV